MAHIHKRTVYFFWVKCPKIGKTKTTYWNIDSWYQSLLLVFHKLYMKNSNTSYRWYHHPDITKTVPMTFWLCCWQIIGQENTTKQTVQCTIRNLTSYEIYPNENYFNCVMTDQLMNLILLLSLLEQQCWINVIIRNN